MWSGSTILMLCLLCKLFVASSVEELGTTHCEKYKEDDCRNSKQCSEINTEVCPPAGDSKRNHCFVVWKVHDNGSIHLSMKGCFLNNEECYDQEKCVSRATNGSLLYCCCEGNNCNKEFFWDPAPAVTPSVLVPEPKRPNDSTNTILVIVTSCMGGSVFLVGVAFFVYKYYYRPRKLLFNEAPGEDTSMIQPDTSFQGLLPIQLIEMKAQGRFGAVWKAMHKTEQVAVKIFPAVDKQSWMTEQEIFKLSQMEHPNILRYIAAEKHGGSDNIQTEYWLITAYHEVGSLCDFLKAHTLTWKELCRVVETMARGLVHLHEELPAKHGHKGKPTIAHRDFKSKNVLLKNDLSACIADFGLALVFEPGKSCGDTHGQVGTRRYMAPEVLEGAINFTPDAFLRIDMYACGLVLWELVSRCTAQDTQTEYRLPFEEEVGLHPTLEDMQESVVQRKVRPTIPNSWRNHAGLSALCDTMEECWDHDAEARLSASCIMERVMLQGRYQNCTLSLRIENEALLGTGKESSM